MKPSNFTSPHLPRRAEGQKSNSSTFSERCVPISLENKVCKHRKIVKILTIAHQYWHLPSSYHEEHTTTFLTLKLCMFRSYNNNVLYG